jgi:hypothetical protein
MSISGGVSYSGVSAGGSATWKFSNTKKSGSMNSRT